MSYNMRLLHIIGSMDPSSGGPCQGIRSSAPELEKLEVYREVVCFDHSDATYLGLDMFPVNALGKGEGLWQYNRNLVPWLRDNLHRFDVVISNGLWIYHTFAICQVLKEQLKSKKTNTVPKQPKIKWFLMPHGMLDPYFQRAPDRKLKALRNWIYWYLVENKVVRQADGLLFTCETELLLARETFKWYQPKREINVGYGTETPPTYTNTMQQAFLAKCPEVTDVPYILFLSRIHPKKGVDLLVKAYIALSENNPDSITPLPKLVIAGPGLETPFGQSILNLVQHSHTIGSSIFFPGMLSGDAKWGAFYGCQAFILPSHQENFGIAVAEALACSKPVLISDQVNIWREIETEGGGIIAENTLDGIQELLNRWQGLTTDKRTEMGEKARSTFEKYFEIKSAAIRFKEAISL